MKLNYHKDADSLYQEVCLNKIPAELETITA